MSNSPDNTAYRNHDALPVDPSSSDPSPAPVPAGAPGAPSRVLVVNADRAVAALIEEWLGEQGYAVVSCNDATPCRAAAGTFALVIVDIPTPRNGAGEHVQRLAREHPTTPVLALSSQFFPGVARTGGVARSLGVAGVLAKPLSRDALVQAVRSLVRA